MGEAEVIAHTIEYTRTALAVILNLNYNILVSWCHLSYSFILGYFCLNVLFA